jgi:hypothetical protein
MSLVQHMAEAGVLVAGSAGVNGSLAVDDMLTPLQRAALSELTRPAAAHPALSGELSNVRAQLTGRRQMVACATNSDCDPR